jgi:hypothetical protein
MNAMNRKEEDQANLKAGEELDQQIYEALIEMGWLIPQTEEDVRIAEEALNQLECPPLPPALADPSRFIHRLDERTEEDDENSPDSVENSDAGVAANPATVIPFRLAKQPDQGEVASSSVLPYLGMLCEVTGETPSLIARELGVTAPFLTLIVQHRESVPNSWRTELVERAAARWGVDRSLARRSLEHPDQQEIAASRRAAYSTKKISYREILRRSGLGPEAQKYWIALAEAEEK